MMDLHAEIRRILLALLCVSILVIGAVSAAPTTELRIVKIGADGVTVLNETTVDYRWMEENLPVLGDGVTHYYHQGPVFEGDKWD
ncbi:MAG TPA: argininosuccinate synthase, partial [Methanoculleus sp.]|nr:argininosuccinate synthase [Methanoculleus sp.]HRR89076.1 argininosuccinate synthase [Methanoculleus sp.]